MVVIRLAVQSDRLRRMTSNRFLTGLQDAGSNQLRASFKFRQLRLSGSTVIASGRDFTKQARSIAILRQLEATRQDDPKNATVSSCRGSNRERGRCRCCQRIVPGRGGQSVSGMLVG
jgi:hypothetical protein